MKKADVTTLFLKEDGSLTSVVIEDFSAPYYDFTQMKEGIEEAVGLYNVRLGEDRIRMTECIEEEDRVRLTMEYASGEDYASFNHVVFEYPPGGHTVTVSEPLHIRTAKKITEVSEGVEILSDKEAGILDETILPAMISTEE